MNATTICCVGMVLEVSEGALSLGMVLEVPEGALSLGMVLEVSEGGILVYLCESLGKHTA